MASRISFIHADTNVLLNKEMSVIAAAEPRKELKRLGDQLYFNAKWRESQGGLATARSRLFRRQLLRNIDLHSVAVQIS